MTRFRTGIINWPGEWVLFSGSGGGLHSRISSSNVIPKKVKEREVAQLCTTLCDSMDCSLPGSSVHGIFQTRVLEWVVISFSRGSSQPRG